MSLLITWPEADPASSLRRSADPQEIAAVLTGIGAGFRQLPVRPGIGPQSDSAAVLHAYHDEVEQIIRQYEFVTVDVTIAWPHDDPAWQAEKAGLRATFAAEHTHGDDAEVRFMVRGTGVFYLHVDGLVHAVQATAGDLVEVPAHTTHWFDMGSDPNYTNIRFFHNAAGWVAYRTGSGIEARFPDGDAVQAQAADLAARLGPPA